MCVGAGTASTFTSGSILAVLKILWQAHILYVTVRAPAQLIHLLAAAVTSVPLVVCTVFSLDKYMAVEWCNIVCYQASRLVAEPPRPKERTDLMKT